MDITDLLAYTQHQQASDLHISSGNQALIRLKGDMIAIRTMPPLEPQTIKDMLYSVMNDQQRSKYEAELERIRAKFIPFVRIC
ncbi:MAG: hypothetical protein EAZ66_04225, partial [Alphaproteobacteria bacterium]